MKLTTKDILSLKKGDVLRFRLRDGSTVPFTVDTVFGLQIWGDVKGGLGLFAPSLSLLSK